ncbi:MAG TPA: TetR/AcrR family transcriptional regulator, partial [Bacteroidetes bacterium]|nr:TetR/AcrR family transcriptional regulator [Bacteroidota bacterium]
MNKRKLQKQKTRQKIVIAAKQEFIKNGFLNTSTAQIASQVGIAHGTLFLHFNNKNNLIMEILDRELAEINDSIHKVILSTGDLQEMLSSYLNELQEAEDFFSVIARELPFYPGEL